MAPATFTFIVCFQARGFVNYYGPQRFGTGQSAQSDQVGLALLKEDMVSVADDLPYTEIKMSCCWFIKVGFVHCIVSENPEGSRCTVLGYNACSS